MASSTDQAKQEQTKGRSSRRREYRGTGIWWGLVVALLLLGAIIALVVQNDDSVRFEWLFFDTEVSLAVLLLIAVFATVVVDELVGLAWRRHRRRRLTRADTQAREQGRGEQGRGEQGRGEQASG